MINYISRRNINIGLSVLFVTFGNVECFISNDSDYDDNFNDALFVDESTVIISKNMSGKIFIRAKTLPLRQQWIYLIGSFLVSIFFLALTTISFYEIPDFVPKSARKKRRMKGRQKKSSESEESVEEDQRPGLGTVEEEKENEED